MKIAGVADTHVALWYLFGDPKLSPTAKAFIDEASRTDQKIAISAISLAELVYLIEKKRLPRVALDEVNRALADDEHVFWEAIFSRTVAECMQRVSRAAVPDLPDRLIAATAIYLNVPIISRDGRIRASNLRTVW
ncbi:MAG TPA: type II toxin-antitoxin system VapC family toxin [Silvibacterium sp.]|nr:type II toxin-antitoxin system VapC family toxin [Silvibacterium sp.]